MKILIKSGDCPSYLTVGKVYEVVGIDVDEFSGSIVTDNGYPAFINFKCSEHLNGGSWEIVNEEA